jgi:4-hydroxy-2-oxoheptanedioate aldolase
MWNEGEPTLGGWLSIPATLSAEVMARGGFDYVCIDTQHGAVDYQTTVELIRAVEHGGSRAIVRVPWNEPGIIGKMLDAGAEGVIVPMVNTVEQAEAAVRACRYAPHGGARSFGPTVAKLRHDDYVEWARDNVAVIPMI